MAVYFDHQIQCIENEYQNTLLSWHKNFSLLAVASINKDATKGLLSFHLDEGELVDESKVEKDTLPTYLVWHPTRKLLASGWENSELLIWNEHDKEIHVAPSFHKSQISCLYWNGTGSRLISADEQGTLCIWKIDQRGRFQQSPMFQHELSSPIIEMVFKLAVGADVAAVIATAARAAVSGDESALDMFDSQKSSKFSISQADSIQMFFGCKDGNVYFLDDRGKCNHCFQVDGSVKNILYYEKKGIVIVITGNLVLTQYSLKDGTYTEITKYKLSGKSSNFSVTWAGQGLIATACKERVIRVLDIDQDLNFVLNLDSNSMFLKEETINCLAYNQKQGILAGGTSHGHVVMWNYKATQLNDTTGLPWEFQTPSDVEGNVATLEWSSNRGLLAVNGTTTVTILSQSVMNFHLNKAVAAVQLNRNQLSIESFPSCHVASLKTDIHIKGVFCTKDHTVIWNGKKVAVYEVSESKSLIRAVGTFDSDAQKIAMHDQNVYLVEAGKVTVRNFQGTVKQELPFSDQEGDPTELDLCEQFLVVGTAKSVLKIYDLSRREARQVCNTKCLEDSIPNFGTILSLKCNCNGSKIAFTSQSNNLTPNSFLYVWDVEADLIQCFNFATGTGLDDLDDDLQAAQDQLTASIKGYIPETICWDFHEPMLLVCQATKVSTDTKEKNFFDSNDKNSFKKFSHPIVVTMFSTSEYGIIVQDHFKLDGSTAAFLGVDIPRYYFVKALQDNAAAADQVNAHVTRRTMRDFVGLEDADVTVKKAMTDFSYLSAIGNMDEAFKAIKTIKSGSVWENMARMCVKTKRLDVALVCLGNMGNACAAKAVRECQEQEAELDAHVAMLAIQIGMYEEAENLYKECQRYDLLNVFYQASNEWKKAIDCAENHDRIHLRTTYYNYGVYLESIQEKNTAIKQYERSDTYKFEVPRMLFDDQDRLEDYINGLKDKSLHKWWAQYLESLGEMESALDYYNLSQDYLSMVRVHCYCGNMKQAEEICNNSADKAACYHLARQYDSNGDIKKAIHFFSRAQAYSNAIRLAKENEMDTDLLNLALLSSPEDILECAKYFEGKEDMVDKAVMLYHKGGRASKAIDLAFKTQQFGALQLISEDLDESADPEVLKKCAEFFIEHDQFDRAVNLLIAAQRFEDALEMCFDHHIKLTEEMSEKMSLPKDHPDESKRVHVLEKIAECAFRQGSYHLATKKFTQAGNKIKAMKSLLKSGDTEKIIFFAGVSRQKEIYVMAANYLQSLEWRRNPEIMKNIIGFYTKGRALESLSSYYFACAQVEIDDFQDYEKAFGALTEAYKSLAKAKVKNTTHQEERLALIKTKVSTMKKFIQARAGYSTNPEESIKVLQLLINDPDMEVAVRPGDVYALVIEHFAQLHEHTKAYDYIQDMRDRFPAIKLRDHVPINVIERIHQAVGVPVHDTIITKALAEDEALEEEINEEVYTDDDEYI